MGEQRYLHYIFEHRVEYGRKIKLTRIEKINKLPVGARPHYATGRKLWKGVHKTMINRLEWGWVRYIEDNDITFYTDQIKPGDYDIMFTPEFKRIAKREPIDLNIR